LPDCECIDIPLFNWSVILGRGKLYVVLQAAEVSKFRMGETVDSGNLCRAQNDHSLFFLLPSAVFIFSFLLFFYSFLFLLFMYFINQTLFIHLDLFLYVFHRSFVSLL
jgi:hypothetical protein